MKRFSDALSGVAVAALALVGLVKAQAVQEAVPVDLTVLAAGLCLVLCVAAVAMRRGVPVEVWWVGLCLVALLPGLVFHVGGNSYARTKDVYLFTLVPACLVAPILLLAVDRARRWFLGTVVAVAVIPAVIVLTEHMVDGRATVGGTNPISTARVLGAAAVVLGIVALRWRHTRIQVACAVITLVLLVATWRTGSRAPLLAAVVALAFVAVFSFATLSRRIVLVCAGVIVAVVAVLALFVTHRANTGQSDSSRIDLYTHSLKLAATHPLGIGWGHLGDHLSATELAAHPGVEQYTHNMPLEVAAEGGWLALAALLVLIVASFRRTFAQRDTFIGGTLLGLWVFGLLVAMTSSDFPSNRLTLVMLGVGLLPGVGRPSRTEPTDERPPHVLHAGHQPDEDH